MKWHDVSIDLSSYIGEPITINFITEKNENTSPWAVWSYPQIYQMDKTNQDYNVIIVSLDTLRADHLNCYQYKKRITSPNMDSLAQEGILFKNFYSNSSGTLSSQISILSGLYPTFHGITYRNPSGFASKFLIPKETLAGTLADNGYYSAAFTGIGYFIAVLDYSKGFHLYNNTQDYTGGSVKNIFPKAFKWLGKNKNRKFFLFLHTYEIHAPFTETYYADKEAIPVGHKYKRDRALYDGGILITDRYVGELVNLLKKNNLLEKTILIVTSDHGEDLGDRYGVTDHGQTLFNEQIHIPCIIHLPKGFPQGGTIETIASSVDLVPTILDILGIESQIKYSGKSLLPIINGIEDQKRFAYSEDISYGPDLKALVKKKSGKEGVMNYKFMYINPSGRKLPDEDLHKNIENLWDPASKRFFNLDLDPGESSDQIPFTGEDYVPYKDIINDIIKNKPAYIRKSKEIKTSQDGLNSLKALGYIQ